MILIIIWIITPIVILGWLSSRSFLYLEKNASLALDGNPSNDFVSVPILQFINESYSDKDSLLNGAEIPNGGR